MVGIFYALVTKILSNKKIFSTFEAFKSTNAKNNHKMKLNLLVAILALTLAACNNTTNNKAEIEVLTVENTLEKAENLIDSAIVITGHVTHTCKHSGKRCFIVGEDENLSIRIEAMGNIESFGRDLVGNTIKVKGTLKERQLTAEYIDQYEAEVKAEAMKEDGSAESCSSEMNNIAEMRKWMKEHNKNYYAIYYVDGTDYEIVE